MDHEALTQTIIGCAMKVHRTLGPGFLELVYQRALVHELKKAGLAAECERKLAVVYDGVVIGEFAADLIVEGIVLIENKSVVQLTRAHEVQIVNYLTATGLKIGLLLNFGSDRLQFKRKYRDYRQDG
ncbi:MAG: GxxExxY protein [Balneolaceae bacterium]|nr:MAG: GxxExxY protein [Balneolaceae bacterium]